MEFRLLGPIEVVGDGHPLSLGGPKQRALLALLLLRANRAVGTDELIEALWPLRPPDAARRSLEVYVSRLRKLLNRDGAQVISARPPGYLAHVEPGQLDVDRFEHLKEAGCRAAAGGSPAEGARLLAEALALWRGAPLADLAGEPFVRSASAQLEHARLAVLETRIDAELQLGRHRELVAELGDCLEVDPYHEGLRRRFMLALYRSGRQAEALATYRRFRVRLGDELGLQPTRELRDLEQAILRQDPFLELGRARGRLPAPASPLVGRDGELACLRKLIEGDVRLLTLTGPGGVGKTRLAIALAERVAPRFSDGAYFIDLAPLADPRLLAATIVDALSLVKAPDEAPLDALVRQLRGRTLLLVLDNFERLLDAGPDVSRLLTEVGGLTVAATSRIRLRLYGEHIFEVAPLEPVSAAELFRARARAAGSDHSDGDADRAAIEEICARLDHLPLAIELAAPRTAETAPAALLERLPGALALLAAGPRDVHARHRTLRATLAWSDDLLATHERRLFHRLAVFSGGCTLEAAETVCDADLRTMQSLVDNSLLVRRGDRYAMLDTIREYAAGRLEETADAVELRVRFVDYFAAVADAAEAGLRGPDQVEWLRRLQPELENLREVLGRSLVSDTPEAGLRLTSALVPFWEAHGLWAEAHDWLEAFLRATGRDDAAWARSLISSGRLAWYLGDWEGAAARLREGIALSRTLADSYGLALGLGKLGWVTAESVGDHARARALCEEGVSIARRHGDAWLLSQVLNDHVGALSTDCNDDYARAQKLGEEALGLCRELGDRQNVVESLNNLGWVALVRGRLGQARAYLDECLALGRELGDLRHVSLATGNLGLVALLDGDLCEADELFRANLDLCRYLRDRRTGEECLRGLAAVAAAAGRTPRAARLWGAAEGIYTSSLTPPERMISARWIEGLGEGSGNGSFEHGLAAGRAMGFDEAVEFALTS